MGFRGKQVAPQFSCLYGGNGTRNLLSHSDSVYMKFCDQSFRRVSNPTAYAPMGNSQLSALKEISRDLYWFEENPARGFGLLITTPRQKQPATLAEFLRSREKAQDNARKFMGLLVATENFYGGEWKTSDMIPLMNGVDPCEISPDTIAAAEYAVSYLNQQREEGNDIKLKQLIRANGQYLGGCSVYWLTMEASDHKFYEAIVLVSLFGTERELKFIRPAKCYPEIPPHLHYLVGPTPELPSSAS